MPAVLDHGMKRIVMEGWIEFNLRAPQAPQVESQVRESHYPPGMRGTQFKAREATC